MVKLSGETTPVPDATDDDAWDTTYIEEMNAAFLAFNPGKELPKDATIVS